MVSKWWDLNQDSILQKSEADNWWIKGSGVGVSVDNSKINWNGLRIPEDKSTWEFFGLRTTDAFLYLPRETASTYGWTSFEVIDDSTVRVIDQPYHYDYRENDSVENFLRNTATYVGSPSEDGTDYMIHYDNPLITITD